MWTALVSGGNRGIGLEVVRAILRSAPAPTTVFLGCRDLEAGRALADALSASCDRGGKVGGGGA